MLNFEFTLGVALFLNFLLYRCWFSNIWQRRLGFLNPPNFYHRIGGSEVWVLSTSSLLPFFPCSKTFFYYYFLSIFFVGELIYSSLFFPISFLFGLNILVIWCFVVGILWKREELKLGMLFLFLLKYPGQFGWSEKVMHDTNLCYKYGWLLGTGSIC